MSNRPFYIAYIGLAALLLAVGCTDSNVTGQRETATGQTITLTASMPTGRPETRLALTETDEGNMSVKWKEGDKISLCFVSGETVRTLSDIAVTNIREDGKKADFDFSLPEGIHYPFNLYGIYGATLATDSKTVTFPAAPAGSGLPDTEPVCVMHFAVENLMPRVPVSVSLTHLGSLLSIRLTNSSDAGYTLTGLSLAGNEGYDWLYNASGQAAYDIASGTFIDPKAGATLNFPLPPDGLSIVPNSTTKVYGWIVPTDAPDASKTITAILNETAMPQALPAKAFAAGNYYRLKLWWDGTEWKRFLLPQASDLVAHWPMDGNAEDISGNEHHGTLVGGIMPTEDHKGNPNGAYLFNGTDAAIHLTEGTTNVEASSLGLPQKAISISAWVKVEKFTAWAGIFSFIQDTFDFEYGVTLALHEHPSKRKFIFGIAGGGMGITYLPTQNSCAINQWYFLTGTYDGTIMKLYVDGKLSAESNKQAGDIAYSPSRGRIGKYEDDNENNYFKGAIDDMRIYNRALSAEEVLGLYYSTK